MLSTTTHPELPPHTVTTNRIHRCASGHELVRPNLIWHRDARRKAGGYWACRECKRVASKQVRERKSLRDRRYHMGYRQMIAAAAQEIREGVDIFSVFDEWFERIFSARLRSLSEKQCLVTDVDELRERTVAEIWEAVNTVPKDDHKKPWNYLQVTDEAQTPWSAFNAALKLASVKTSAPQPKCANRSAEFSDYDEETLPTAEEAARLCAGCDLFALCEAYAKAEKPAWGVHAGEVYVQGKVV